MSTLDGISVVVTRSSQDADTLAKALEGRGAEVIRLPTISIDFPEDLLAAAEGVVDEMTRGAYEWLVFSSSAGVRAFAQLVQRDTFVDIFGRVHVAAVGSATVESFRDLFGREVDLVPERFTGKNLADALGRGDGGVLLPRPEEAPRSIVDDLAIAGWTPHEVALYRTVPGDPPRAAVERVKAGDYDVVTFTSGSTVRYFGEIVGVDAIADRHHVVVIGPSTEQVARETGLRVDAVAQPHTTEGVVAAVESVVGR